MGLETIDLDPEEAEKWIVVLRACGFTVEVDEDALTRLGPRPKFQEILYVVHLRDESVRVLFTSRHGDSKATLVFCASDKNCSQYLRAEISKAIKEEF